MKSTLSLPRSHPSLNDDTKILTETKTFFTIPNFPKPRFFSETKFFRNRNRYFSSETKFSETETETFFRDQIFPKPRLFFRDQILRNRYRNPPKIGKRMKPRLFNILANFLELSPPPTLELVRKFIRFGDDIRP